MSKIVGVTGATGMIGRVVVEKLLERGYEIKLLLRESSISIWGKKVTVIRGDVGNPKIVNNFVKGCDYLIHLAVVMDMKFDKNIFNKTNVSGVKNILNSVGKTIKVVMVSSVAVFKDTGNQIRGEDWPINDGKSGNYYVDTKVEGLRIIRRSKNKVVTVMPSIVVSEENIGLQKIKTSSKIIDWLRQNLGGGIPGGLMSAIGSKDRIINIVEVNDVAEGIILAMEKGKLGEEYILGGQNFRVDDYLKKMSKKLNRRYLKWRIPYLAVSIANLIFNGLHIMKPENMYFSDEKAKKDLGYNPKWKL